MNDHYQAYLRAEIAKTKHALARPGNDPALTAALTTKLRELKKQLPKPVQTTTHAAKPAPDNDFYPNQPPTETASSLPSS